MAEEGLNLFDKCAPECVNLLPGGAIKRTHLAP